MAKAGVTAFMVVFLPVYWHTYGPTNFLWFCDAALLLTFTGMWMESPLLISASTVGILLPQCLWLVDFGAHLAGFKLLGLTSYMFDLKLPWFTRGLSLFHGWLPLLLLWLVSRCGYDRRALPLWTAIATVLALFCFFFTPAAGVHLVNANLPVNLNYVYGFNDQAPQHWVNQNVYVGLWLGTLWLVVFLPTHLVLLRVFQTHRAISD